jgi:UDP-galactopyranose mutase
MALRKTIQKINTMNNKYDYLIVGAGLFGAVCAHRIAQMGKTCLVIDKRSHIGGNCYCENIEGIHVHKYGAHIFHTSNKQVWDFVNSFVEFNRYTNAPIANYQGKLYNLPFNMNTFTQMWGVITPAQAQNKINEQRAQALEELNGREPANLEEQALLLVGRDIYEKLIKGYTEKQWGRPCTSLPAFIIKRLPVRLVFDNNYFNDLYQGIPIGGYNLLIEKLLTHADILLDKDYLTNRTYWNSLADKIIFTGSIDAFFNYQFGHLEYRTVRFETEVLPTANYQGNAVVNYTEASIPYTRIIEHKHFEMFGSEVDDCPNTVISREYSSEWQPGIEPYYPVNNERNSLLYQQYAQLAEQTHNVIFGGRLAEYKYYDMDDIIERALMIEL